MQCSERSTQDTHSDVEWLQEYHLEAVWLANNQKLAHRGEVSYTA